MNKQPEWKVDFDDNDNHVWEAASPLGDEEGSPWYWRIRQQLRGNVIEYYFDHEAELMALDGMDNDPWGNLDAAKEFILNEHSAMISEWEAKQSNQN